MSLLTNQTAINLTQDFFVTSAGTVESVSAGSNVELGGTSNDPVINVPGPFVRLITAGSNITVSGTSNITINSTSGANYPTSYANPNVVNFSFPTLTAGNATTINLINPALYPNADSLYRATICYEYASATFATTPSGNLTLSIFNNNDPNLLLTTHSVPFTANLANGNQNIGGILTAIFRPVSAVGGGSVALLLVGLNSSGVTLTSASCVCTVFAVEEITTSFTLIATSAGGLTAPP